MQPSQRIVEDANRPLEVTDSMQRRIEFRRPSALDTLRLFKAAGPELAQNEAWLSMASLAFTVTSINDVPVPQPANEGQIEGLVVKLGHAGITAIAEALDRAGSDEDIPVGNLQGTQF